MKSVSKYWIFILFFWINAARAASIELDPNFEKKVSHDYADSNGVKIHFASIGQGPLIVMIHGYPSFWYTWCAQMDALSKNYRVVAIDQRGYNLSDKPKGVKNYNMSFLIADVAAVIKHLKYEKAIIVGHDWGGDVAWKFAIAKPEMTDRLIVLSDPHPNSRFRELQDNPIQRKNRSYSITYLKKNAHTLLTAEGLANWVKDPELKKKYVEAFKKSDFEAMLNYYKSNHLKHFQFIDYKIKVPVLMIHGLADTVWLPGTLNNSWNWLDGDFTLVTIPHAGHQLMQDAPDIVTRSMKMWLDR